jgi:hypothetical protein
MFIKLNSKGVVVFVDEFDNECSIHLFHSSEAIDEIIEDVATPYIVVENATNHARIHLVTDFSKDEALMQVYTYLSEKEGDEDPYLLGVFECKIID